MSSYYNVASFDELNNRMDCKVLEYKSNLEEVVGKYPVVKLGRYIEQINSPAKFEDNIEYKFYDTSVNSVNEKGEFVDYKLINSKNKPSRAKQVAIKDTIIVANLKTNKGKACIVTDEEAGSIISSGYLIIKPKKELDIEYLKMVLQCEFSLYYLRQIASTGLGMANWSYDDLSKIKIILPPLSEQQRTLPIIKEKIKIMEDRIKELEEEKEHNTLQSAIDRFFKEELGLDFVSNKASNILYTSFDFNEMTERLAFKSQINSNNLAVKIPFEMKLGKIVTLNSQAVIRRRTHIKGKLIEFKDIKAFSGEVINYNEVDQKFGSEVTRFKGNDLMYSKMNPHTGNMVLVSEEYDDYYGSAEFWGLNINKELCITEYLLYVLGTSYVLNNYKFWLTGAQGSSEDDKGGRARLSSKEFLNMKIPLPSKDIQKIIIEKLRGAKNEIENNIYVKKIEEIQSIINSDLNKYILHGYGDDLFQLRKAEE